MNNILENKLVSAVVVVLGLLLLALFLKEGITVYNAVSSGQDDNKDILTISATGEVDSKPDIAYANLAVMTEGKDPKVIQDDNVTKINAIIDFLKNQGIPEDDIQTQNYNLYPQYSYFEGEQELTGYVINQTVNVKMRDLEKVGAIMAGAIEAGANTVNSLSFQIEDPEALRQEARKQALENAKAKAQELASVAGVKLGKVKSFSESGIYVPQSYAVPSYDTLYGRGGSEYAVPDIEPGSTKVTASVSVTFELD